MPYVEQVAKDGKSKGNTCDLKEIFGFLGRLPRMMRILNMTAENLDTIREIRKIIREWKGYKDSEECGEIVKLPCTVGDTIFRVNPGAIEPIIPMMVREVRINRDVKGMKFRFLCQCETYGGETYYLAEDIGKNVYTTWKEANDTLNAANHKEIREF